MCCCSCCSACLFTAHVGSGSPASPVEFSSLCHSHKLSRLWLLGPCHCSRPLRPGLACLFTVLQGIPLPPSSELRGPHLFAMCLYCYCLLLSFSFLPGWGPVCPGGYADLAQGCLWEYCIPLSLPCLHLPKPSGHVCLAAPGALLISVFNVKWRCSVQAGGVEGSKFCLFLVALPSRCVSSIS
jgi:hypothetical protein